MIWFINLMYILIVFFHYICSAYPADLLRSLLLQLNIANESRWESKKKKKKKYKIQNQNYENLGTELTRLQDPAMRPITPTFRPISPTVRPISPISPTCQVSTPYTDWQINLNVTYSFNEKWRITSLYFKEKAITD